MLPRVLSLGERRHHGELKVYKPRHRDVAEPEPIDLDWSTTALVIIDMQRDFMEPGGFGETLGNDVSQLARAVKPIAAVLAAARDSGMLVVHTREGHLPDLSDAPPAKVERGAPSKRIGDPGPMGRILIRGEAGHDIIPELYPLDSEIVIDKPGKGAFYATELGDVLQKYGIENLLVCGVTTEVCVNTTVREANDRGYRCVVIADGCASYFPEFHEMGLKMIKAQGGIFGWVADSAAVLKAMAAETSKQTGSGGITMSTTTATSKGDFKPALWTPGDWNAFFGFGTNILVNMLVLTGLLRFVLKMPDSLVFGRILPALGLMMCLSTFYYAWLAYRLAQKTGRNDVCALPSGVSVPHMFIVTFVIMLPITLKTGDPVKGWSAGLVWVFFQSFILMIGGFIAPFIRRITPRAALLGTLAGVSVTFISMRPALEMYMTPQIGLVCFAIILASWFGGVRYYKGIPAGLVAIAVGMIIAWGSNLFGLGLGGLSIKGLGDAFANFGFSVPIPAIGQVFSGFEFLGIILVTAIPFGIYDLVEAMDNVESAEAAGDEYPTTRVLTADGAVSLIGCLMGNPFINAVYIGHPGWKSMGGRIGYSAATGIMVVVLSWFGIISVLLALVPVVAISPILLYIGMLIGAQAFQTTPIKHAPAVVLALTPHLAAWAKLQIDTMLGATMTAAQAVGGLAADKVGAVKAAAIASLPQQGVIYHGLEVMGGGSILTGLVLGAIGVFVIERDFVKASAFALTGAVLTYFGFMHGEAVGIGGGLGVTPPVALAYAVVAAVFYGMSKYATASVPESFSESHAAAPAE